MIYCFMRRISRIGSSMATTPCRRDCRPHCGGRYWSTIRVRPIRVLGSTPNEHGSAPAGGGPKDPPENLRCRHPSEECVRRFEALSQPTLVGAFADLRGAHAPGISEGVSLSQEPAASLAPR